MTRFKTLLSLSAIALLSAAALSADVVTDSVNISFTSSDTLTNLFLLYAQGDISRAFRVTGSIPANVTTDITVAVDDIPFPVPGTPYISLVGVYTPADGGPSGVVVALDPTDAATLIANGTSFSDAFSSFSPFFSESDLVTALENPDITDADGFSGSEIAADFADIPEQQDPALFAQFNLTGPTDQTLVQFSNATSVGSVEFSIPSGSPAAAPEPSTVWMLGAALLAIVGIRTARQVKVNR